MNSIPQFYKVNSGDFTKELEIPTSKSYANRLLILGSLFPLPITIKSAPKSTDVLNLINCLRKIGLEILEDENALIIQNSFPACEKIGQEIILETGDGGTTNRFLMALLARGKNSYILRPDPLFLKRPIEDFLNVLSDMGVSVEKTPEYIKIKGPMKLKGDNWSVNSQVSSQFVSALALSLADLNIKIVPKNLESSKKYFVLTQNLIDQFKKGEREFLVPIDFSSLSYPAALAALSGELIVKNYSGRDFDQADSSFLDILRETGVYVSESETNLLIKKSLGLSPFQMDCSGFLDLVPTLSFLFSYIPGKSILKNIKALRYKESDRILEIQKLLKLFNIENRMIGESDLEIIGAKKGTPFIEYDAPKDHRMIMTAYLFMRFNGGGIIKNHLGVNKSFPGFFDLLG